MESQVSVKQIIKDFIYIGKQLENLFKDRSEYKLIIDFILAKNYLDEDLEIPLPKMKDVEEATGLKSHTLRKLLTRWVKLFERKKREFSEKKWFRYCSRY